jgi:DNA-binding SARP family transcriptional activator
MLDPLREDIHRELMRAYAAQGRVSAAIKQFGICRETLSRELGIQPERETRDLYQNLRRRRETAALSEAISNNDVPISPQTRSADADAGSELKGQST